MARRRCSVCGCDGLRAASVWRWPCALRWPCYPGRAARDARPGPRRRRRAVLTARVVVGLAALRRVARSTDRSRPGALARGGRALAMIRRELTRVLGLQVMQSSYPQPYQASHWSPSLRAHADGASAGVASELARESARGAGALAKCALPCPRLFQAAGSNRAQAQTGATRPPQRDRHSATATARPSQTAWRSATRRPAHTRITATAYAQIVALPRPGTDVRAPARQQPRLERTSRRAPPPHRHAATRGAAVTARAPAHVIALRKSRVAAAMRACSRPTRAPSPQRRHTPTRTRPPPFRSA